MLKLTILLLILLNFSSKSMAQTDQEKLQKITEMYQQLSKNMQVNSISPASIQEKIKKGEKIIFVDVREKNEQEISTLPHAITSDEFEKRIQEFSETTIVVYCTIGYRSGKYCEKLKNIKAYNLAGGVLAWSHAHGEFTLNNKPTTEVHTYSKDWNLLHSKYKAKF